MEEGQDSDHLARSSVLSSDGEDQSYNGFDHLLYGSSDGDEIRSPFHSPDEQTENERNNYSARSDYSDERNRPEGVPSSPKRRKIPEVDRISDLPDSVIHHILSFLPAEDAVRTSVLSKRWMYLWTSSPKLVFRGHRHHQFHKFLRFVDKTLFFYSSSKIEKFDLEFDYSFAKMKKNRLDSLIQKWLRLVTRRDTEELSLKFCTSDHEDDYLLGYRYPIPQFVFNSSSLKKLSTIVCDYAPKGQVCWTSLRVLTIEHAELSNDGLQRILLGSPMLQYMKLNGCRGMTSIDISSRSVLEYLEVHRCEPITHIDASSNCRLEKLVFREMQNLEDEEHNAVIEILCPNLKSLEISGNWFQKICRLLNVSSLIDVCLTFGVSHFDYIDISKELLEKIKHAKKITLGTWCVQVLSLLEFRGLLSPLSGSSCECLTLNTEFNKWYPFGVAHLLHCFPTLQKLVIDMSFIYEVEETPGQVFPKNYQERVDRTFVCLLEHLKTIEIAGLTPYQHEPDDLELVRFLLGNARVLKEMVIHFESEVSDSDFGLYGRALLFDRAQKLLSFPRCSPHAIVLID